jgi:DNA polymerase-1
MRRVAKTVNFGVIYGISAFGLSETLNIGRKNAEKYIRQYFERHPGVRGYMDETLKEATKKGYVSTIMGRKRAVPELKSQNKNLRQQGERLAINSPIQGAAADIIKIAMIKIRNRFINGPVRANMILQVHDELLFEVPTDEIDLVKNIVKEEMEGAICLSVPLKVEIGYGKNWAEAH